MRGEGPPVEGGIGRGLPGSVCWGIMSSGREAGRMRRAGTGRRGAGTAGGGSKRKKRVGATAN